MLPRFPPGVRTCVAPSTLHALQPRAHLLHSLHPLCPTCCCPQVFRTYNASITLDTLLAEPSPEETVEGRKAEYDRANKEVGGGCTWVLLAGAGLNRARGCWAPCWPWPAPARGNTEVVVVGGGGADPTPCLLRQPSAALAWSSRALWRAHVRPISRAALLTLTPSPHPPPTPPGGHPVQPSTVGAQGAPGPDGEAAGEAGGHPGGDRCEPGVLLRSARCAVHAALRTAAAWPAARRQRCFAVAPPRSFAAVGTALRFARFRPPVCLIPAFLPPSLPSPLLPSPSFILQDLEKELKLAKAGKAGKDGKVRPPRAVAPAGAAPAAVPPLVAPPAVAAAPVAAPAAAAAAAAVCLRRAHACTPPRRCPPLPPPNR